MRKQVLCLLALLLAHASPSRAAQAYYFDYIADLTRTFDDPDPSTGPWESHEGPSRILQYVSSDTTNTPPDWISPVPVEFYNGRDIYDVFTPLPAYDPVLGPLYNDINTCTFLCLKSFISGSSIYFQSILYPGYGERIITFNFDHDLAGQYPANADGFVSGYFSDGGMHHDYYNDTSGPITSLKIFVVDDAPQPHNTVPEPATWAMMIVGFGFVGGAMRSRRVGQNCKASLVV